MKLDLLSQDPLRDPGFAAQCLALNGTLGTLNVTPLSAATAQGNSFHEPSLVWHERVPLVALVVAGCVELSTDWKWRFPRTGVREAFSAVCICPQCDWGYRGHQGGEAASTMLLEDLEASRQIPELSQFRFYVLRNASFASLYRPGSGATRVFQEWGVEGTALVDIENLRELANARPGLRLEPLRRGAALFKNQVEVHF